MKANLMIVNNIEESKIKSGSYADFYLHTYNSKVGFITIKDNHRCRFNPKKDFVNIIIFKNENVDVHNKLKWCEWVEIITEMLEFASNIAPDYHYKNLNDICKFYIDGYNTYIDYTY